MSTHLFPGADKVGRHDAELCPRPARRPRRRHGERRRGHRRDRHPAAGPGDRVRAARGGADHGRRRADVELRQNHRLVAPHRLARVGGLCAGRHPGGGARRPHAAGAAREHGRDGARRLLPCDDPGPALAGGAQHRAGLWRHGRGRHRHRLPDRNRGLDRAAQRARFRGPRAGEGRLHRDRGRWLARALHQQGHHLPGVRRAADRHRREGTHHRFLGDGRHLSRAADRRAIERGGLPVPAGVALLWQALR